MEYAGPLWLDKIFDRQFIELMQQENSHIAFRNSAKISKLLSLTKSEADEPITYFVLDQVSQNLGLPVPSVAKFLQVLHDRGYKVVPTHFNSRGIRTNASSVEVQKVLRELVESGR
jgi:tRNA (guanine26-N2/guanine27-N2)-dimethyltransferase